MASLKSPESQVQDLEPCKFPQLNKAFIAPDERLLSSADLSSEIRIALQDFCKAQDVKLEAVIQAAWALTLRIYLGSDNTLFGYENLKICGNRFDTTHTILQHLKRAAESGDDTSSVSWCSRKGSDIGDLFNSELFVTSDQQSAENAEHGKDSKVVCIIDSFQTKTPKANGIQPDLKVVYVSGAERSTVEIRHNVSFVDAAQGQRMAKTICKALAKIVSEPSTSVAELSLVDEDDLEQIWEWNHVIPEDPQLCAHDLLQKQAQSTPDALAIRSWDGDLTYAEFDTLSSVLGRHLSSKGVIPNMVIPICFEKCKVGNGGAQIFLF